MQTFGRKVRSHAALNRQLDVGECKIKVALMLSRSNLSCEGRVLRVPLYMAFCLDELVQLRDGNDFTFAPVVL